MKSILQKLISKGRYCLALDIGTSATKLVLLAQDGNKPVVMLAAKHPTPTGFWNEIIDQELPCDHLKELAEQYDLGGMEVISFIGGDHVVTRQLTLPKAASKDITGAVAAEAGKVMSYSNDELIVRHILLGEQGTGKLKEMEILFAAVPKLISYQYHEQLIQCGLTLVALDLPTIALWRLFRKELTQNETVTAIIDVGENRTCMVIARGQQLQYIRTLTAGGYLLTGSMADGFGLSTEQAKAMKEESGLILDAESLAGADTTAMQIDLSLRDGLGQLIKEIRRSLDYYYARDNAASVNRIILTGGTSKLNGFSRFISEALEINAEVAQPSGIVFDGTGELGYDPAMAVAYGLALRELQNHV